MEQVKRLRYTVKEAAQLLGISVSQLYIHLEGGDLVGHKVSHRRYFTPLELAHFIQDQAAKSRKRGMTLNRIKARSDR